MRLDNKTKQVQVRLTPELHKKLKIVLTMNDKKLVDFFTEAASAYLANPAQYEKTVSKILGGHKNG